MLTLDELYACGNIEVGRGNGNGDENPEWLYDYDDYSW